ncbi:MAG: DUF4294 domain-containing protein, partial [Flavobacteriales bacterium]|nr:DUF4294 domain-containing protein [Flavobacteriales bacterium]
MRPTIIILLSLWPFISNAQKLDVGSDQPSPKEKLGDSTASALINGKLYEAIIVDGDTIPIISLPPARVSAKRVFKSRAAEKKYRRLIYHIKKAYPYAKLAGEKMREVEEEV